MSTKRRFWWLKVGTVYGSGEKPKAFPIAGKMRRPICAKCGKKIRDLSKVVRKDGKAYHKKCLES